MSFDAAERRKYLGASELAAACGLSEWITPTGLALRKLGLVEPKATNATRWGTLLEAPILAEWSRHMGCQIDVPVVIAGAFGEPTTTPEQRAALALEYTLPGHPWVRGHLDALSVGERRCPDCGLVGACVIDAKNPGWRMAHEWGSVCSDDVPVEYAVQMQCYMAMTDRPQADLAVLIERTWRVYHVRRDPVFLANLVAVAEPWWRRIEAGERPPLDGSEEATELARREHPSHVDGKTKPADDAFEREAMRYHEAHLAEDAAKKIKAEAGNRLREMCGDAERVEGNGYYVLYRQGAAKRETDWQRAAVDLGRMLDHLRAGTLTPADVVPSTDVIDAHTVVVPGNRTLRPNFNPAKGKKR